MEFDKARALLLIELYRRHRILWDPRHPLYYAKGRKASAWAEVAGRVGGAVLDVRRKMESLLGSFRRERARSRKGSIGPRGKHEPYYSTWFAYDHMQFLTCRENPKKPKRFALKPPHALPEDHQPKPSPGNGVEELNMETESPFGDVLQSAFGGDHMEAEEQVVETQPAVELAGPEESELPTEAEPPARVLPRKSMRRITRLAAREDLRTIAGKSWRQLRISAKSKNHVGEDKRVRVTGWRKRRRGGGIGRGGGGRLALSCSPPPLPSEPLTTPTAAADHSSREQITRITSSVGPVTSSCSRPRAASGRGRRGLRRLRGSSQRRRPSPPPSPPPLQQRQQQQQPSCDNAGGGEVADAFGTYVASKLRAYSPRTRSFVEHLMSNVLFEADMGKYQRAYDTLANTTNAQVRPSTAAAAPVPAVEGTPVEPQRGSAPLLVSFHDPSSPPAAGGGGERGEGGGCGAGLQVLHVEGAVKTEPMHFESVDNSSFDE